MEHQWYFPNRNGGGGGTVIVEGTDYKTITIPVISSALSAECSINDIKEDAFGWSVQGVSKNNGIAEEIEIQPTLSFSQYSADKQTANFVLTWQTAFSGYILINYWNKNS